MEKNLKIGFVILNYCAISETKQCILSIKWKVDTDNYQIIVVDNGSPNGTGQELYDLYNNDNKIHIVLNKENLGFASGNNIGFLLAKNIYHCDFICILNSDTYLLQDDFFERIQIDYEEFRYFVLGPDVITPNEKEHCNPMGKKKLTYFETWEKMLSLRIQLFLNLFGLDKAARSILKKMMKTSEEKRALDSYLDYQENVKLHGCCWIFSPLYIENHDGLIEGTFLYLEEDLLYLQMMNEGKRTLYSPKVKIYHLEDASVNLIKQKGRHKRRFVLKNHLQSMRVIRKYLKYNMMRKVKQ